MDSQHLETKTKPKTMKKAAITFIVATILALLAACTTEPLKEEENLSEYFEGPLTVT